MNTCVVFNTRINRYRLVLEMQYRAEIVWVKFVGNHAQYDRSDVESVNEYSADPKRRRPEGNFQSPLIHFPGRGADPGGRRHWRNSLVMSENRISLAPALLTLVVRFTKQY